MRNYSVLMDKILKISKLGKTIYGTNIENNKSISVEMREKDYKVLKKYKTSVSKTSPSLEVLHPLDFQSVKTENKRSVKSGQKVTIVLNDSKVFLV